MKFFDRAYLNPKKFLPQLLIAFILLNAIGYGFAINSAAHVIATKAVKEAFGSTGNVKVRLLPWGFKLRTYENDGDASLLYYISNESGSKKVSVLMVKEDGKWRVAEIAPF